MSPTPRRRSDDASASPDLPHSGGSRCPPRGRAGALTGQALIDAIRLERRREFVFEGQRWFDLSRWDLLNDAIIAKTEELQDVYPGETDVHGVPSNLWPIPQSELDINPNLTQNPGY